MTKTELYMKLDAIKLALETSAILLGKAQESKEYNRTVSEGNIKSINATIHIAEKVLRDILSTETKSEDDQEEDD